MPYMIGGAEPSLLAELARTLRDDPEVTVRRIMGAADRPSLLAVDMTPARAEALKALYGPRLTIEPDSPVEPY
ncbi:hypothetical protein [Nonomuraea africana]|uniref:Uncharacterized protein n=1 Tax=Nonomuraea africana TaxID=46171 RepID=A0ABR9KWM2_9ACTN|nr:hypothetical protein [Nonomuraea africana]MBE1566436.1 hypothetical protein [Nonomuraea africana]